MTTGLQLNVTEIVQKCLLSIEQGESIQACVARYAEYPELDALLRTATLLQHRQRPAMPSDKAQMLEQRLLTKIQGMQAQNPSATRPKRDGRRRAIGIRYLVAACAALIIFFLGGNVIDASASALPGDNLYSLKRTVEQIDLQLSTNQAARNQVYEHIAEERLFEGTLLALQNKPLDASFVLDTNTAVNTILQDNLSPGEEAQLATRANYLSQLLKQQNSQLPAMHQLTASLDRLAVS